MPPLTSWLVLAILALTAPATPPASAAPVASFDGQREFDYFALALQWPGTYCQRTRSCCPSNGCCRGSDSPTTFTIHGLWPDYNDGTWPSCCSRASFNPKEISTLTNALEQYWPSLSCGKPSVCHGGKGSFWAHEAAILSIGIEDLKSWSQSVLNDAGYVPSNTERYPLGGIISAIENAFHASPLIICSKDAIEELRLCFYKDLQPRDCAISSDDKIDMVTSKGSCPKYVSLPEPVSVIVSLIENSGADKDASGQWRQMKALRLLFMIIFLGSFFLESPEADSCTSNLSLNVSIPFDTTNLHCLSVWDAQSFILRYAQTYANIWSFILSTPDTNSYIAMGFSVSGGMVGSSAMVGWVASRGASGGIKQYYLGGVTPNQVVPDKGNLQVIANSTFITLQSSRLFMVFQLQTAEPLSSLIFATGSTGLFPAPPSFALTKHLDKVSTRIDYSKANIGSSQGDGNSSQVDGSTSQAADSCVSKLNLSVPLLFDTTNLDCLPVWNARGYILRYSQTSPNIWSFILSAPNTNSYIAMGFSPNGGMVGSSAIVGWISSSGAGGGMKQYYLTGLAPNQVVPDRGNLKVLTNSTFITSQSSRLYMAFQLETNQPLSRLIYAFGPNGVFPSTPSFALTQHQDKVSITLNYATGSNALGNSYMNLKRSHGVLNILGWGILIIMGAIVARYFREWDPFWFYFHASVQSLGFVLGVIGVISGFVLNNQLHVDVSLHKALGIIIFVLACLQIMALIGRPKKESKVRKYWNLYHHNTGRILIILAVANIFYGIQLGKEGSGWNIGYGIVLAILLTMALTFETQLCSKD
ncbi:hypothetical protein ACSQ67_021342 [Phaseolus vulgaris]